MYPSYHDDEGVQRRNTNVSSARLQPCSTTKATRMRTPHTWLDATEAPPIPPDLSLSHPMLLQPKTAGDLGRVRREDQIHHQQQTTPIIQW